MVVVVGLPDPTVSEVLAGTGVGTRRAEPDEVTTAVDRARTLIVLAAPEHGIPLAQRVQQHAREMPVLFLTAEEDECQELSGLLAISPGIGRRTRCLLLDDPETVPAVHEEIDRSRRRVEHHQTMSLVRTEISELTAAPPETMSRYLGQLFDHAPIGILLTDAAGTIQAANPEIRRVLGWQPRQTVGVAFDTMFGGDDAAIARDLVTDCVTSADVAIDTLVRAGPTGSTQHLEITVAPVDPERSDLGLIVLLRDESARIQALESAQRSRREAEAAADRYAKLAWTLQESLLPAALPPIEGVELASRYHPAGDGSEIGGDFYDVFPVGDDEWLAVIGDVCGKGVGAARLTALSRYTLRAAALRSTSLRDNLEDLNAALLRQYEEDRPRGEHRFTTAAAVRLRRRADGVDVDAGSGGHLPPLLLRADGRLEELSCRGALLGMFADTGFVTARAELGPADVLVLYTDGVVEARRGGEQFGEERLGALLRTMPGRRADDVAGALMDAVLEFQDGVARDDTAILAIGVGVGGTGSLGPAPTG